MDAFLFTLEFFEQGSILTWSNSTISCNLKVAWNQEDPIFKGGIFPFLNQIP
jgi:hypothetical protein